MIIAITNQKGGCAKTTSAINLAASMASLGQRTLLIDLDPQTHATLGMGIHSENLDVSIYNVLSDRSDQKQFIENVIRPFSENLDIAPGHVLLSTIEQEYVDKDQAVGKLKSVLKNLVFPYQQVIIDCPPSLGFLTFNALFAADLAVVPVELSSFALYGVAKLLSMIELIRVKMDYAPKVCALPTMVDLRSRFSKDMLEMIKETFKDNLFQTIIRMNVSCKESQRAGMPVLHHQEKSSAAKDYLSLAREIMELFHLEIAPQEELGSKEVKPLLSVVRDFEINLPDASAVYIVGDFNNWRIDENSKLWNQGRGDWQKRLLLEPGKYRYKYVVDGKWVPDPSNNLAEPNPYGGIDSVLEIN